MIDVASNVAAVRERIAAAAHRAGRNPADVRLIAAAKTKGPELIEAAIRAGVTDIGENYVQEAAAKRTHVRGVARWHMIGHLQRNKVARALEVFDVIQTVDSLALGQALSRRAPAGRSVPVLVEVNLAGEQSKSGAAPDAVPELVAALRELPSIAVAGLMTIPPPVEPDAARPYFRRLSTLRDALGLVELSMGMTDDFEAAIEEGATMVRVGRALFGERPRA